MGKLKVHTQYDVLRIKGKGENILSACGRKYIRARGEIRWAGITRRTCQFMVTALSLFPAVSSPLFLPQAEVHMLPAWVGSMRGTRWSIYVFSVNNLEGTMGCLHIAACLVCSCMNLGNGRMQTIQWQARPRRLDRPPGQTHILSHNHTDLDGLPFPVCSSLWPGLGWARNRVRSAREMAPGSLS